jgi:hypothetical protein
MTNKQLKLPNTKYAVVNMRDTDGDNTNSLEPLAWFTTAYADKIIEAVDFGSGGGGTGSGDVTREQFNNEVQARKDGDATLTTNLNKEIQDRENADATLQENINAEKTARENADTTLTTNLNNEIKARTDGDSTLTTNLNKEIQDRKNADTTLQNNIDGEVTARTKAIENVNTAITNEREARISADNSINQKLTQETTSIKSNLNKNTSDIASLNSTIEEYWKIIYPVGSIYISTSATFNPNTEWGGMWEQTASGRCLIGANDTYPLGSMGGESTHTLTIEELPQHSHGIYGADSRSGNIEVPQPRFTYKDTGQTTSYISGILGTELTGGGRAHNNMQPYLAVYMWKRTR